MPTSVLLSNYRMNEILHRAKGNLGRMGYFVSSCPGVRATVKVTENRFELLAITADEPGKGAGSDFMRALCRIADRWGAEIWAIADPLNPRLPMWYARFYFVPQPDGSWVRQANKSKQQ